MNATAAHEHLALREPVFARLIDVYGQQDPFTWHDGGRTGESLFVALLVHITGQRISAAGGFALFDRIAGALGGVPTPEGVLSLGAARLRGFGLTQLKTDCALSLANALTAGHLDLESLRAQDDHEVIEALTNIRGIGLWSAQAFLMRQLRRPDVLPPQDAGLRAAVRDQWKMAALPGVGDVRTMATRWSPYRSYAAALLWRSRKPVGEISDPKARALARAQARAQAQAHVEATAPAAKPASPDRTSQR